MENMAAGNSDYARIERAIRFLQTHAGEQPGLATVAAEVGLGESHFQRLFQRWAGVSPKRLLQWITLADAKRLLVETRSVLDTSLAVGLSGGGRLHDLFVTLELMTPGEYKERARGLTISWGIEDTPFGPALFAVMKDRGLCGLSFVDGRGAGDVAAELRARWPEARLRRDPAAVRGVAAELRRRVAGKPARPLSVVLKGTPLQLKVWEALLRIPPGGLATYGDVARLAGAPTATRAVGSAIGHNQVACLIPCHRVIRSTGLLGEYRWGAARKAAMLGLEQCR